MLNRKEIIAQNFGDHVDDYDCYAEIQRDTADTLAAILPDIDNPKILEIGSGTGFLSKRVLKRYPDCDFMITDLCPQMTAHCEGRFGEMPNTELKVMDGENPDIDEKYDLIVSSMAIQWFEDPVKGLENLKSYLKPGGKIYFTSLGEKSFQEWRQTLKELDLPEGVNPGAKLPGKIEDELRTVYYPSTLTFLKSVKMIGAHQPKEGYKELSAGQLKRALTHHDETHDGAHSWHIVYGCLEA